MEKEKGKGEGEKKGKKKEISLGWDCHCAEMYNFDTEFANKQRENKWQIPVCQKLVNLLRKIGEQQQCLQK